MTGTYTRRREFITLLGGAATGAWPHAAGAQQPAMPVVGWLGTTSPEPTATVLVAFRRGLNESGYVERQNVAIEYRWAEGKNDRLPDLAADLVRSQVTVIGKQIEVLYASTGRDIDTVIADHAQKQVDALLVGPSALANNRRVQLVTLAAHRRMPAMYPLREYAEAGGLMSYGTSITDAHRRVGIYAGRILKGEKPADLPVMQSINFEFVININTAKVFGLNFPPGLLAIADEVIE